MVLFISAVITLFVKYSARNLKSIFSPNNQLIYVTKQEMFPLCLELRKTEQLSFCLLVEF